MKNFWDDRFKADDFYYGKLPNDFLKENFSVLPSNGKVLCLAEGEGRNAVFLAKQGFRVTAVDLSSVGLQKLKNFAQTENVVVETICADLGHFEIAENEWDGIVSIWCHVPSSLRKTLYLNCVKGLKPGASILIEAYTPDQLKFKTGGPQDPDLMPTLKDLQAVLTDLHIVLGHEITREISEGTGHCGTSAVVQIVATKK